MKSLVPIFGLAIAATIAPVVAAPNNPPNLTISGERYRNPNTYLFTGTVQDESRGVALVYRVKRKEFRTPIRGQNWRLRVKLRDPRTRVVFFAIDRQGRRSARQKRVLVPQPPQEQQPRQRQQR